MLFRLYWKFICSFSDVFRMEKCSLSLPDKVFLTTNSAKIILLEPRQVLNSPNPSVWDFELQWDLLSLIPTPCLVRSHFSEFQLSYFSNISQIPYPGIFGIGTFWINVCPVVQHCGVNAIVGVFWPSHSWPKFVRFAKLLFKQI